MKDEIDSSKFKDLNNLVNVLGIIRHGVRNPGSPIIEEFKGINSNPKELTIYGIRGSFETGVAFANHYKQFLENNKQELTFDF